MESNGEGMISTHYKAEDFLGLNLSLNSPSEAWDKAIFIFKERFQERYFGPIEKLLENAEINGFAIMALNCLLVDTFYQFEEGLEHSNNNRKCYVKFLRTYMGEIITSDDMADRFYKDIRCGILHSAQTQRGSMLAYENGNAVEYINGSSDIRVNVVEFSEKLNAYFQMYVNRLRNGNNRTRQNFITKMNYICNKN